MQLRSRLFSSVFSGTVRPKKIVSDQLGVADTATAGLGALAA